MSAPGTAAEIAARIIAGTADPSWFADMSCDLIAAVVAATPSAAMAASAPIGAAIRDRVVACQAGGFEYGPGFLDSLALAIPVPSSEGLKEFIARVALTLVFVGAGFGMILLGLRSLTSPLTAPQPSE